MISYLKLLYNCLLVVFLHGGPGGGTDAKDRQFFNPEKYKVSTRRSCADAHLRVSMSYVDCPI